MALTNIDVLVECRPMRKRGVLSTLFVAAAAAAVGLVAAGDAAGGTMPAALMTMPASPASSAPTTGGPSAPNPSPWPPGAPTNLRVAAVSTTTITLAWDASPRGCCEIAGYDILYMESFGDVGRNFKVEGEVTTAAVPVSPGQQYVFGVNARDSAGRHSPPSNTVTAISLITDGPGLTPPPAPSGLTVTGSGPDGATLRWSPADGAGIAGYRVYWFDGWFANRVLDTVPGTTYTAEVPKDRNLYYVRTVDTAGNVSLATNTVTVNRDQTTTPPVPPLPPACRVTYAGTAEWGGGFVASVTVTNAGEAPVDGWTLTWRYPGDQQITSSWGGTATQTGADVTVRNAAWNTRLDPGASATVGVMGTWTTGNAPPTAFTVNGKNCTS